jgi:predicted ATP-grasp superfamily ATP-dependent carboligase
VTRLYEFREHPALESPVLILSLEGWIDAGGAAARATVAVLEGVEATPVVEFDADVLLDHRSRRPVMHLDDGMNQGLRWPSIQIMAFSDVAGADALLLVGAEPDHQWRAFTRTVVDLAMELGVRMVVGLGAYPAPVPHTRPARLATTANDSVLRDQLAQVRSTLDVPAGIGNAIEERCAEVGLPAVGIWAQVPHYASTMPYPGASLALVEGLNEITGLAIPTGTLAEEADASRARLDDLVADSAEHLALLRQLEAQADATGGTAAPGPTHPSELPSGEDLASEIERFLRGQDDR